MKENSIDICTRCGKEKKGKRKIIIEQLWIGYDFYCNDCLKGALKIQTILLYILLGAIGLTAIIGTIILRMKYN
jgi:hypothetical protein